MGSRYDQNVKFSRELYRVERRLYIRLWNDVFNDVYIMRHGAPPPSLVCCVNLMRSHVEDFARTMSIKRKREYNCR